MGSGKGQAEIWNLATRDWVEMWEPKQIPFWDAMLDEAGVGPGKRFFDAGCGGGGASLLAAQRRAKVNGLDASETLAVIAQERIPGGDFCVGDMEDLPYRSGAFDAVIASFSVQYTSDWVAATRELGRVCAANGHVLIGTWGKPEECDQMAVVNVVRGLQPPPSVSGRGPFALSEPGALESLVRRAGLTPVGTGEALCTWDYPDLEAHWRAQSSAGPFQVLIKRVGEKRVREAVDKAVQPYMTDTGRVCLKNRLRYVAAQP